MIATARRSTLSYKNQQQLGKIIKHLIFHLKEGYGIKVIKLNAGTRSGREVLRVSVN